MIDIIPRNKQNKLYSNIEAQHKIYGMSGQEPIYTANKFMLI